MSQSASDFPCRLATECVADRRTDSFQGRIVDSPNVRRQRRPRDRVEAIAVDHGWSVKASRFVIEVDFRSYAAAGSGDLSDGHESTHVDDLWASENEDRPSFVADLREPDVAARHSSVQASTSDQKGSGRSG